MRCDGWARSKPFPPRWPLGAAPTDQHKGHEAEKAADDEHHDQGPQQVAAADDVSECGNDRAVGGGQCQTPPALLCALRLDGGRSTGIRVGRHSSAVSAMPALAAARPTTKLAAALRIASLIAPSSARRTV